MIVDLEKLYSQDEIISTFATCIFCNSNIYKNFKFPNNYLNIYNGCRGGCGFYIDFYPYLNLYKINFAYHFRGYSVKLSRDYYALQHKDIEIKRFKNISSINLIDFKENVVNKYKLLI